MRISDWSSDVCSSDLGHQQLLDLAEAAHHQAAVVVELRAHADGDVEAFVDHVHAAVAHVHLHAHLRVLGEEVRQQRRDLLLRQPHRHADPHHAARLGAEARSEEHTSELQSLMRISYAVFCLKKKKTYDTAK